jgi:hypothetical protein
MTTMTAARLRALSTMPADEYAALLNGLRAVAAGQVAAFPQYEGRFAATVLVRAKRDVRTKLGLAMTKGEPLLLDTTRTDAGEFVTIWSFRNRCHTSVRARDIVVVEVAS